MISMMVSLIFFFIYPVSIFITNEWLNELVFWNEHRQRLWLCFQYSYVLLTVVLVLRKYLTDLDCIIRQLKEIFH